jgi:iron(III) transport system permease protein
MSRISRLLAGLALFVALVIVVGWPALATVLEATDASADLERALKRQGWDDWALKLAQWRGQASQGGPAPLDFAGSEEVLRETRGLSRPLRLGFETLALVLLTELLALPAGVILAILLFRTDVRGRRVLLALITLAAFVPLPLHATAWLGALGNAGRAQVLGVRPILVGRSGAAVVHALFALPWVVLLAGVGLCAVEPELEESASLEMAPARVIARVTLRRSIGAIAAAALAVAVLTAGDMTVTDLIQIRTYAEESYVQYILGRGPGEAAAVTLMPLLVLGSLILLVARALGRIEPARLISSLARPRLWRLGGWRLPGGLVLAGLIGNVIAMPLYSLAWRAGRVGGRAHLGRPPAWSLGGLVGTLQFAAAEVAGPLVATLLWTTIAAMISTGLAGSLAWSARRSRCWQTLALAVLVLTLATPGPVVGMALVLAYRDLPSVYDSPALVVLAQTARSLPYALLLLWPFLRAFPREYLEAAALDGFGEWGQISKAALPLSWRALVAAGAVSLALALGELPATNLVAPPGVPPLSVVIWGLLHTGVESHLAGVALVSLAVVATAALAATCALWSVRALRK